MGRLRLAQQRHRINGNFRRQGVETTEMVESLQDAKQGFHGRTSAGFQIAQGPLRDAGLLGGSALIQVAGETQAPKSLAQSGLQFVWGFEFHDDHTGDCCRLCQYNTFNRQIFT